METLKKYRLGNQPDEYELVTKYLGWLPEGVRDWMDLLFPYSDIPIKGRELIIVNPKDINEKIKTTFIIYIAPHKVLKTLQDMMQVYGDIKVVLAHELTKMYQSVDSKNISDYLTNLKNPKGEYIMLINLEN